jgi:hypothetical protein
MKFKYTPVLKSTGERIEIPNPEFSQGFNMKSKQKKGIVTDLDTGKKYAITGKSCGLGCYCDAFAEEITIAMDENLHTPVFCSRPNCMNDATRWYEEGEKTIYVCLEHEDVEMAEDHGDGFIINKLGKEVEMAVYSCSESCHICNH